DRVGAGDAFMAGLIFGWINEKTEKQTLEFATASCAMKHSVEGDVNVCTVQEIDAVLNGKNIGKLLR
ncbi:MAG TPA: PfkB family carbohydrate kinase, partial [Cyclobacteriaceae bacterium]|nr:PfkB family carbohydrate kinase [Cyclobacteriaceae bacterium]